MKKVYREEDEYSHKFDEYRKNRVEQSFYKYGPAKENYKNKLSDALANHELAIKKYRETGNTEYLCDAANYLMFEFMWPSIDGAYFKPTSSEESAGFTGTSYVELMNHNKVF